MPHKTLFLSKEKALLNRRWVLVDAKGKILGRLASRVATLLRGKHRADWTPHVDGGDHIVIINAEKVILTGRKLELLKLAENHRSKAGKDFPDLLACIGLGS